MAIFGIGTDIVEIERFESKASLRLAQRILTDTELEQYQQHKNAFRFLAKRFAAKEAACKALGTGIAQGVSFQDFEVSNKSSGQPVLNFSGKAAQLMKEWGITDHHISISDEKHYAVATVILESL